MITALGEYGTFKRSVQEQQALGDIGDGFFKGLVKSYKEGGVGGAANYSINKGAKAIGADDEVAEVLGEVAEIGAEYGAEYVNKEIAEKGKAKTKEDAKNKAREILKRYSKQTCESLSENDRLTLNAEITKYAGIFKQLGLEKEFVETVKNLEIPTNCGLATPKDKAKKYATPIVVGGVVGGGVYYLKRRVLYSIGAGAASAGLTYYLMNKDKGE